MAKTSIEWTDESTNPLRYHTADGRTVWACVKVSPGCANCYSAALSERFAQRQAGPYNLRAMQGLTPYLDAKEMRRLLTSKALSGKRVFMCDMTDLFGEWVSDEMIAALFGVMAARPDVTFQVLTKHAERMARWFALHAGDDARMAQNVAATAVMRAGVSSPALHLLATGRTTAPVPWPLPNIWIGVSVEDQRCADERIPHLLRVPATVRFLSVEPMLGAVDLSPWLVKAFPSDYRKIDWIIVGGESRHGARPMHPDWPASIAAQCKAAGVPYFWKQQGSWLPFYDRDHDDPDWRNVPAERDGVKRLNLDGGEGFHGDRVVYFRRTNEKNGDVAAMSSLRPADAAAGVFRREWPKSAA